METSNVRKYPNVGEKLYLQQRTGLTYVDMVRTPYTVIGVTKTAVTVQADECIFKQGEPIYYNTMPIDIVEDKQGQILTLHWSSKLAMWQIDKYRTGYPEYAYFTDNNLDRFFPYLD